MRTSPRPKVSSGFGGFCAAVVALIALLFPARALAACAEGNLLSGRAPLSSRGTAEPTVLADGRLAREGDPANALSATRMKGMRPYVEWDLGEPTSIAAAAVQADNNDTYGLSASLDGRTYTQLWVVSAVQESGLRERITRDLKATARFIRFEAYSGDQVYAATEVRVYCKVPAVWPPTRLVKSDVPANPEGILDEQALSLRLLVGIAAFPVLLFWLPRLRTRGRRTLAAAIFLASAGCWVNFGRFLEHTPLHYWDMFHYFMGSKYFPEDGYFELYRCVAHSERESGRDAALDRTLIRDVETNQLLPGDFTRTNAGRCRASFSPERWSAFKRDLEHFSDLFPGRTLADALGDHGFNGTPTNTTAIRVWTRNMEATRGHLMWLAQLDTLALVATVAAIGWGLGLVPALICSLVLGIGAFWCYPWVGGCLARHWWLVWCAFGVACLARGKYFAGGASLTVAGLMRLFPFAFVFGALVWAIADFRRNGKVTVAAKRLVAGIVTAFVVGNAVTCAAVGPASYKEFSRVFDRHSKTPSANQLGLAPLLAWDPGEKDDEYVDKALTDPMEPWTLHQLERRAALRPLWAACTLIAFGLMIASALAGAGAAETVALAGLPLFCLLPMTSYDYTWVVLLLALWQVRPKVPWFLLGIAVWSHAALLIGGEKTMLGQHILGSLALGMLLVYSVDFGRLRTLSER